MTTTPASCAEVSTGLLAEFVAVTFVETCMPIEVVVFEGPFELVFGFFFASTVALLNGFQALPAKMSTASASEINVSID